MPAFSITVTTTTPELGVDRTGEVSFTVTNQSSGRIRGRAEIKPEDPAQASWLQITDTAERDFEPDGVQVFVVRIKVPTGAPGGTCKFQLNMRATLKGAGEEQSVAGPSVSVSVPASVTPKPKPFPWWIVAVAAGVVLVIGGGVAWWIFHVPDKTGQICQTESECNGELCVPSSDGKICMRRIGASCEHWDECATLFCNKKRCAVSPNGASCQHDVQCESGNCQNNVCAAVVAPTACSPPCRPLTVCQNGRCVPLVIQIPRLEIERRRLRMTR